MKINACGNYVVTPEEMAELVADVFGTRGQVVKEYLKVTDAHRQFQKTMERIRRERDENRATVSE